MPAKPGTRPPNAGRGRKRGSKNRFTADVRQAVAAFAQNNVHKLEEWIATVAKRDPGRAAELFLRALEFYVPKLARSEIAHSTGPDYSKPLRHWTTRELEEEIQRLEDKERDANAIDGKAPAARARRSVSALPKPPVPRPFTVGDVPPHIEAVKRFNEQKLLERERGAGTPSATVDGDHAPASPGTRGGNSPKSTSPTRLR